MDELVDTFKSDENDYTYLLRYGGANLSNLEKELENYRKTIQNIKPFLDTHNDNSMLQESLAEAQREFDLIESLVKEKQDKISGSNPYFQNVLIAMTKLKQDLKQNPENYNFNECDGEASTEMSSLVEQVNALIKKIAIEQSLGGLSLQEYIAQESKKTEDI